MHTFIITDLINEMIGCRCGQNWKGSDETNIHDNTTSWPFHKISSWNNGGHACTSWEVHHTSGLCHHGYQRRCCPFLSLGRPFTNTANVGISVTEGKCTLQVDDEEITFDVREAMKHPKDKRACFKGDIIDEVIEEQTPQIVTPTPLKLVLTNVVEDLTPKHNDNLGECIQHLHSSKEVLQNKIEQLWPLQQ